jgi:hypothetical protein
MKNTDEFMTNTDGSETNTNGSKKTTCSTAITVDRNLRKKQAD